MKFWYALNKNLTSQAGRFVYDNTLSSTAPDTSEYFGGAEGEIDVAFYLEERSAEATFTIPEEDRHNYSDFSEFLTQHDEIKAEQNQLTTELVQQNELQVSIRERNLEYYGQRSELSRIRSRFEGHKVTHAENIDRLAGQLNNPQILPSFIETAVQYDPPPNNTEVAQFLIDNGVQPGPALSRMVQAVQNLLQVEQNVAIQQAEIDRAQAELDAQAPEIEALNQQLQNTIQRKSEIATRLSDIYYQDLPNMEKEKAGIDIQLMLSELQEEVDLDGDGVIDQLTPAEQVEKLILLSQLETTTDAVAQEERNWREYLRDGVGFALESTIFSEAMANWSRQQVDSDPKVQILRNMSDEAVSLFVQHYPHQAMLLTTDMVGPDSFRIDFLGNNVLESQVDLVDYFPTQPEFIQYNGELAYLSALGNGQLVYKNAADNSVIEPETNYVFTILNDTIEDHPELADRLATDEERSNYWQAETLRGVNETLTSTSMGMMLQAYGVSDFESFQSQFLEQYGQFSFATAAGESYERFIVSVEGIRGDESINVLTANERVMALQEAFQAEVLALFNNGHEEISSSNLSNEEKSALIAQLNELRTVLSPENRNATLALAYERIEVRRNEIVDNIIRNYFRRLSSERRDQLREDLLNAVGHPNPEAITQAFLLQYRPDPGAGSDLRAELMALFEANRTAGRLQEMQGALDSASIQSDIVFSDAIQSFWSAPSSGVYQQQIQTALSATNGETPSAADVQTWLEAIQRVQLPPVGSQEDQRMWLEGKNELIDRLQRLHEAALLNQQGQEAIAAAEENIATTDLIYQRSRTPQFEALREAAEQNPAIADDPNLLAVLYNPETDMEALDVPTMLELIQSEGYQGASPEQQASMMAQTTNQPISIKADANTLQSEYNFHLPAGVNYGRFTVDPSGETRGSFESSEVDYIVETDGTIIAEHLTGVPDAEDLMVPPEEWATAQALGAMTKGFVVKSAAELAQAGETLGNVALVNFMRQYWGIRGRDTLPESELDQFKSLGEMMSDNHINLHTVLHQLNATKWDETAAGNRATDVRYQFNEILAAAAAGNNEGFRELLRLDELPADELETGPDIIP